MTVHLVKLSVGARSLEDFEKWVAFRSAKNEQSGRGFVHDHVTRMVPRRKTELLDGGSIYWVIKGTILARQVIIDFETHTGEDGIDRCAIILDPPIVQTEPVPRRAFQGWRYLSVEDAPSDVSAGGIEAIPPALRQELAELGLL